jgi:hypothetical protein
MEEAMSRRLKQVAALIVVLFVAAQLVRPSHANPPTDARRTIQTHPAATPALVSVLDRSCGDCHSNATAWPWYTQVAPVSWAMVYGVRAGRKAVNFSEWAEYSPERQRTLLAQACSDVSQGKMPGSAWTLIHPSARLSAQDIQTICAAAHS